MELARVGVGLGLDGNRIRFMVMIPTAVTPQQIGVRNPIRIKPPVTTARPPRHQEKALS